MSDTEIVDWLSKNHVSINYYGRTGGVEITWFKAQEAAKTCITCRHTVLKGSWPHFRGKDLREAVKRAIESEENKHDA